MLVVGRPRRGSVGLAAIIALSGCGVAPGELEGGLPRTAERQDAFARGVERIIPIRVVSIRSTGSAAYTDTDVRERTARLLARTNATWRVTGVQFSVSSVTQLVDDGFANNDVAVATQVMWSTGPGSLEARLEAIVGRPVWAVPPKPGPFSESQWMSYAILAFGAPEAMYAVFGRDSAGGFCDGVWRNCYLGGTTNGFGDNPHLAHEFGHAFGVGHPEVRAWDPRTAATATRTDMWDMFYCPGTSAANPNKFFPTWAASKAAGTCPEAARLPVAVDESLNNCTDNGAGQLTCNLAGTGGWTESHGPFSAVISNSLSFTGTDDAAPNQYGRNVMAYNPVTSYAFFSASEVRIIRDSLRHDRRIDIEMWAGDPNAPYGGKPRLGQVAPHVPLGMIDFNGDGQRDIALYKARPTDGPGNTGEFVIRTAPTFASGPPIRRFGRLDDVPVPAFYDADAITDQAIYRPGEIGGGASSDASSWYWCPSNGSTTPPSCEFGGYSGENFGIRDDVPLPGLNMGAGRYLAVYRPSNGTFYWRQIGQSVMYGVQVAVPGTQSVPLPGLYDADDLIDFATYDMVNARFDLVLSSTWWDVAQKRTQVFPVWYKPIFPVGASLSQRTGAFPVGGVQVRLPGGQVRAAFAVFDAASSRYAVSWDTLTLGAAPYDVSPQECYQAVDLPLGGLAGAPTSRDTLAGITFGVPMGIRRHTATTTGCSALPLTQPVGFTGDGTAVVVPDVSGDGLPDILVSDPQLPIIRIIKSNAGFTTSGQVYIGGPYSQLL